MKHTKADIERARETLLRCYPKGSTVYTILRSVSRSGMQRVIGLVALKVDPDTLGINEWFPGWSVSVLLGYPLASGMKDGVKVNGCGFDAGYDIAYNLGRVLYDDGYSLKHRWL